ncbi:thiolase-like protein [Mycena galopus ATCC 62051]|nr:thiolase-like protein [Mycena galopus ATCC 62051]
MPSPTLKITGFGPSLAYIFRLTIYACTNIRRLDKVLAFNRCTGIKARSLISPILDLPEPASIKETSEIFLKEGLALALSASRLAIAEAGLAVEEITHVVATTCTNSSNPGYDSFLAPELDLRPSVEKVLLNGVGCAGGLAALRLAASMCQSAAWRGEPAHVLVNACEITSSMLRDELRIIDRDQQVRLGITLFGDGAASLILSLDLGDVDPMNKSPKGIYELVNWSPITVPDTHLDRCYFDRLQTHTIRPHSGPRRTPYAPPICRPEDPPQQILALHPPHRPDRLQLGRPPRRRHHPRRHTDRHGGREGAHEGELGGVREPREHELRVGAARSRHAAEEPGREWVVSAAFGLGVTAEGCLLRRAQ